MPIKYNNYKEKDDFIGNVPISEQINEVPEDQAKMADMLSNIIKEKQKSDNTSIIKMMGALTPVTYYHTVSNAINTSIASDAQGPADVANDSKSYEKIKNFLVKIESSVDLTSPDNENDKAYNASGSLYILPRTIQPVEGDYFIMEYYNKTYCWFVTSVELSTFESGTGFKCAFEMYKKDYTPDESQVVETYIYHHEFTGTTYRPILTNEEFEILQHGGEVYNHLSDVFNDLFYNRSINNYIFKDYDYEKSNNNYKDINNINTLGLRGGVFRAAFDGEDKTMISHPRVVKEEAMAYDNFLNEFVYKNKIFRKYNGMLLTIEPLLTIDRISYKRSVYNCIETNTVAYFKNTSVSPINVPMLQQGLCSYLVGKKNVIYHENDMNTFLETNYKPDMPDCFSEFFPHSLTDSILNGKNVDMNTKCTGIVYASIENFIIETITRYIYNKTDDFIDRIKYLYENLDNLYEHEIAYNKIFYLFPMLGYVIEHTLQKLYSDNIDQ